MKLQLKICTPYLNSDEVTFMLQPERPADATDFVILSPKQMAELNAKMSWEDIRELGDLPF